MPTQEFRIYKPNKENKGAASKLQLVEKIKKTGDREYKEWMLFWTGANQIGMDANDNASFDWDKKDMKGNQVVIKLGDADVGEILGVLNGRKGKAGSPKGKGLYHDKGDGQNSSLSLEFKPSTNPDYDDQYYFRVSVKDKNTTNFPNGVLAVQHTITLGEAEFIREILTAYIRNKYVY